MTKRLTLSVWLLGAGAACGGSSGAPPLGEAQKGLATFYDATGAGNCSFDASPSDLDVAAINAEQYDGSAVCGACAQVTGPNGQVTVRIVDKCPDCERGQLDLSREAFAKIAEPSAGRVSVDWKLVPCAVSGPLAYRYKDGSSQYWTAIQVRNHKLPVRTLEWKSGDTWVDVHREDYNYFVIPNGAGAGPVHVRVTAWDGQTLEDTLPSVVPEKTSGGHAQFQ